MSKASYRVKLYDPSTGTVFLEDLDDDASVINDAENVVKRIVALFRNRAIALFPMVEKIVYKDTMDCVDLILNNKKREFDITENTCGRMVRRKRIPDARDR